MSADAPHIEPWSQWQGSQRQEILLTLYNQYYIGLMNYGMRLTGDRALTNDCIVQVLLRIWDRRSELPAIANTGAYLHTALRRELFASLKEKSRLGHGNGKFPPEPAETETSYEEYLIHLQSDAELRKNLASAMEKLSGREKELLRLRFFEDLDYDEIADQCQITKRTAYNMIYEALKKLKGIMVNPRNTNLLYGIAGWAILLHGLLTYWSSGNYFS